MEPKIDEEFEKYHLPLPDEAFAGLEADIKKHGCLDPLIVWKEENILIDGHHRYKICTRNKIPYRIEEMTFGSRDDVLLYIIDHQRNRRNCTKTQLAVMATDYLEIEKRKAASRQGMRTDLLPAKPDVDFGKATQKAAEKMGVSTSQVQRVSDVRKKEPVLVDMMREGTLPARTASRFVDGFDKDERGPIIERGAESIKDALNTRTEREREVKKELMGPVSEVVREAEKVVTPIAKAIAKGKELNADEKFALGKRLLEHSMKLLALSGAQKGAVCPKCGSPASESLRFGCCGMSIEEAKNYAKEAYEENVRSNKVMRNEGS